MLGPSLVLFSLFPFTPLDSRQATHLRARWENCMSRACRMPGTQQLACFSPQGLRCLYKTPSPLAHLSMAGVCQGPSLKTRTITGVGPNLLIVRVGNTKNKTSSHFKFRFSTSRQAHAEQHRRGLQIPRGKGATYRGFSAQWVGDGPSLFIS